MGLIRDLIRGPTTADKLNEVRLEREQLALKEMKLAEKEKKRLRDTLIELGVENQPEPVQIATLYESIIDPEKYTKQPAGFFGGETPFQTEAAGGQPVEIGGGPGLPPFAVNAPSGAFMPQPGSVVAPIERGPVEPGIAKLVADKMMLGLSPQKPEARKTRFLPNVTGVLEGTAGRQVTQEIDLETGEVIREHPQYDPGRMVDIEEPSGEVATYTIRNGKIVPGSKLQKRPPTLQTLATESELTSHRHIETGEPPPIGSTKQELRDNYTRIAPPKPQTGATKAATALKIVDQLDTMVDELFPEAQEGLLGRVAAGAANTWNQFTQSDPKMAEYEALRAGTSSLIVKALGEAGTLSEGDNARALNLTPQVWPVPDSYSVASGKMKNLRSLLAAVADADLTAGEKAIRIRAAMDEAERLGSEPTADELEPDVVWDEATGRMVPAK